MQVPLHALSQQTPSTQKPEAQVPAALQAWPFLLLQLPLPSQACPLEQLPATSVPALANTQVPSDPATLHDLHGPVQLADSQQTPSTQLPEAQEAAVSVVRVLPASVLENPGRTGVVGGYGIAGSAACDADFCRRATASL